MQTNKSPLKILLKLDIKPTTPSDVPPESISYDFIYGIGTYGLSPLEKALGTKMDGDAKKISINTEYWEELFGHLPLPEYTVHPATKKLEITATIISMVPADNREVIQALARSTECGGGCACGCGGH